MADESITVQLEGAFDDQGQLRLGDFIEELGKIKNALTQTERIVTGRREIIYRIVSLSYSSPLRMRVAGNAREPQHIANVRKTMRTVSTALRLIRYRHQLPLSFDVEATEAFADLAKPVGHIAKVIFIDEKKRIAPVDESFRTAIASLVAPDEEELGSLMGTMEDLRGHGSRRRFVIYSPIGARRVVCEFGKDLKDRVYDAAGKYVRVDGTVLFKKDQKFPHAMKAEDIEILEQGRAIKFSEVHGIAPTATGGISAEDFVRNLRDANW